MSSDTASFRQPILPLQDHSSGAHYEVLLRPDTEQRPLSHTIAFRWLVSEADEREHLAMCAIKLVAEKT